VPQHQQRRNPVPVRIIIVVPRFKIKLTYMLVSKFMYRTSQVSDLEMDIIFFLEDDKESLLVFDRSDFYLVYLNSKASFKGLKTSEYNFKEGLAISSIKETKSHEKQFITFSNGDIMVISLIVDHEKDGIIQAFEIIRKNTINPDKLLKDYNISEEMKIVDLRFSR
jgi:hypothetical protein